MMNRFDMDPALANSIEKCLKEIGQRRLSLLAVELEQELATFDKNSDMAYVFNMMLTRTRQMMQAHANFGIEMDTIAEKMERNLNLKSD